MRVAVFGLGYVGSVSAANFAADGHDVIGVDVNAEKVAAINAGLSPIVEPGLEQLLKDAVESRRLRATTSTAEAIAETDLSLVCVGTPSRKNGSLDLSYLIRVCEQIGDALKDKPSYHVVVIRSTVLPGTTHGHVIPTLEARSGKKYGEGFGVSVNPEFLREGTALKDFRQPPLTLVGHNHAYDAAPTKALYDNIEAPLYSASIRTAEMIKYTSNAWHAVKVVFANEIGNLCKRVGIDSHDVMDIFCRDEKLNISANYLKPGFAFGGFDQIVETGKKRIGILGFSFKAGTDDLRESPMVILGEALLGKGYELCIYDRNVSLARLMGANKEYIEQQIPHLSRHLCDSVDDVISKSDVIVIGNGAPEFAKAVEGCRADQTVIDLVRLPIDFAALQAHYDGICW
ncbi:MAG: GDP-mannose dehydrogenase [Acidobacteria bacterium]|nr:MAG: GDP-mannose dehydrogenase [Acidobacteriota bacterium]